MLQNKKKSFFSIFCLGIKFFFVKKIFAIAKELKMVMTKKAKFNSKQSLNELIEIHGKFICENGLYEQHTNNWPSVTTFSKFTHADFFWQMKHVFLFFANETFYKSNFKKAKSSYGLKHVIERKLETQGLGYYISNGVTLLVAEILGLNIEHDPPNSMISIDTFKTPRDKMRWNKVKQEFEYRWSSKSSKTYVCRIANNIFNLQNLTNDIQKIILEEYLDLCCVQSPVDEYRILSSFYAKQIDSCHFQKDCKN